MYPDSCSARLRQRLWMYFVVGSLPKSLQRAANINSRSFASNPVFIFAAASRTLRVWFQTSPSGWHFGSWGIPAKWLISGKAFKIPSSLAVSRPLEGFSERSSSFLNSSKILSLGSSSSSRVLHNRVVSGATLNSNLAENCSFQPGLNSGLLLKRPDYAGLWNLMNFPKKGFLRNSKNCCFFLKNLQEVWKQQGSWEF